jgi:hypothetical protein
MNLEEAEALLLGLIPPEVVVPSGGDAEVGAGVRAAMVIGSLQGTVTYQPAAGAYSIAFDLQNHVSRYVFAGREHLAPIVAELLLAGLRVRDAERIAWLLSSPQAAAELMRAQDDGMLQ